MNLLQIKVCNRILSETYYLKHIAWYLLGTLPIKIATAAGSKSRGKKGSSNKYSKDGPFWVNARKIGSVATYLASLPAYITKDRPC